MSAFAPLSTFQVGTGLLPNEGVPFSRWMMVPPELPQQRGPAPEGTGGWSSEETQIALAQVAMLLRQLGRRTTPTATTQPAAPPPAPAATDPLAFWRCEIGYFFPEKHVDVRFLASGLRPCDDPRMWTGGFEYQDLKLPVNMAVAEMVRRVGVPGRGLQEMQELVVMQHGTRFGVGQELSRYGPSAALTLEQIGWDERRALIAPIWVVLGHPEP